MSLFLRYIPLWLLLPLLWVLLRRRAYQVCPYFFAYVGFGLAADLVRLATRLFVPSSPGSYVSIYWITEAGYCVLGILAMYEVLRAVFINLPQAWWHRAVLPIILLVSTVLSLARTEGASARFGLGMGLYVVVGEMAARFVQVFVFAGVATLAAIFGLRWRQYFFGVAMGFGLYATVMLLTTTRLADSGTTFKFYWGMSSLVAYSIATLIWIWFFAMPPKTQDPEARVLGPLLR